MIDGLDQVCGACHNLNTVLKNVWNRLILKTFKVMNHLEGFVNKTVAQMKMSKYNNAFFMKLVKASPTRFMGRYIPYIRVMWCFEAICSFCQRVKSIHLFSSVYIYIHYYIYIYFIIYIYSESRFKKRCRYCLYIGQYEGCENLFSVYFHYISNSV